MSVEPARFPDDAGVVDETNKGTEGTLRSLEHCGNLRFIRDIGLMRDRAAPAFEIASTTAMAAVSSRAKLTRIAWPSCASLLQIAAPIPRLPPVTITAPPDVVMISKPWEDDGDHKE